ncbi:Homocysteine S-methyltransferase 1 [Allomyces javanicus]|nr:Homocysteine S-methyltransferase 1 [Allomyces javanicus]
MDDQTRPAASAMHFDQHGELVHPATSTTIESPTAATSSSTHAVVWGYASRLAPWLNAVLCTAPLLIYTLCWLTVATRRYLAKRRTHHSRRTGAVIDDALAYRRHAGTATDPQSHPRDEGHESADDEFRDEVRDATLPLLRHSPPHSPGSQTPIGHSTVPPSRSWSPITNLDTSMLDDDDDDDTSETSDADGVHALPMMPATDPTKEPPPTAMTWMVVALTLASTLSHLFCLVYLAALHLVATDQEPDRDLWAVFPWWPITHAIAAGAWMFNCVFLYLRRYRWDCTWVVGGYWALAASINVMDLYNHVCYWSSPTALDPAGTDAWGVAGDVAYARASLQPVLLVPLLVRHLASVALLAAVMVRFHYRSPARAILQASDTVWTDARVTEAMLAHLDLEQPHLVNDKGAASSVSPAVAPNPRWPRVADVARRTSTRATATTTASSTRFTDRFSNPAMSPEPVDENAENGNGQREPLLSAAAAAGTDATGTAPPPTTTSRQRVETSTADKFKPPTTYQDYLDKFGKLAPFVWPARDRYLQCLVLVCGLLLFVGRVVNVLLPLQYKALVDCLTPTNGDAGSMPSAGRVPWEAISVFVLLRFLQGSVGMVNTAQDVLWIPVGQYTTRAISLRMFQHLHSLSHRFHLTRKTGEILRVQDRGVSSVVSLLSTILFNILPTLVDIAIAVIFFIAQFDMWFGLIVFVTMVLYIWATIHITEIRTKYRRKSNALENEMEAKAVDSLLNFETVKFYNAERFECAQYAKAIAAYQAADWQSSFTSAALNFAQNTIIQIGLLAGSLLCAHRVAVRQTMSVGDFVLYMAYITQLYGPLNYFGSYYRQLQKNFVDMEKMLDLLAQEPEIRDLPRPAPINPAQMRGKVTFQNVVFAYDPRVPTLRGISFDIPAGKTVALVGSSGSGKSTILRLLFRFYDVQGGRILIDGVDIRHMAQSDLRSLIGVVPQDTVLFNDSIRYNIRYGRVTSSDQEVEEAARAAQIHDRIMGFPDKYETKVGERGTRLSGGEKQRVAIARTVLKNPVIAMYDEASSALDTATERMLQRELRSISKNKTTLIIAHRLSTVIHADMILVVHHGEIVERGSHEELLRNPQGVYHDMWEKQLRDNEIDLERASESSSSGGSSSGGSPRHVAKTAATVKIAALDEDHAGEAHFPLGASKSDLTVTTDRDGDSSPDPSGSDAGDGVDLAADVDEGRPLPRH